MANVGGEGVQESGAENSFTELRRSLAALGASVGLQRVTREQIKRSSLVPLLGADTRMDSVSGPRLG